MTSQYQSLVESPSACLKGIDAVENVEELGR
jgi:hypothetical protein